MQLNSLNLSQTVKALSDIKRIIADELTVLGVQFDILVEGDLIQSSADMYSGNFQVCLPDRGNLGRIPFTLQYHIYIDFDEFEVRREVQKFYYTKICNTKGK